MNIRAFQRFLLRILVDCFATWLPILATGFLAPSEALASSANTCFELLGPRAGVVTVRKFPYDSAVEMEMPVPDQLVLMLTTKDGTLQGLKKIVAQKITNQGLLKALEEQGFSLQKDWRILTVDSLPPKLKVELFRNVVDADRMFAHKLIFQKTVSLTFRSKVRFLGQQYAPGTYQFQTSNFLDRDVDLPGANEKSPQFGGAEIHLRTNGVGADEALASAWNFQRALGLSMEDMQIHIVGPPPEAVPEAARYLAALKQIEFRRRLELVAQMAALFEGNDFTFSINSQTRHIYAMSNEGFKKLSNYWQDSIVLTPEERREAARANPDAFDMKLEALVAQRTELKYDGESVTGLEFRTLPAQANPYFYTQFVGQAQRALVYGDHMLSPEHLAKWSAQWEATAQVPENLFPYSSSRDSLSEQELTSLLSQMKSKMNPKIAARIDLNLLKKVSAEGSLRAFQFLFFDWGRDPLLFENEIARRDIRQSQIEALNNYLKGQGRMRELLVEFLQDSDVFNVFRESLDVPDWFSNRRFGPSSRRRSDG